MKNLLQRLFLAGTIGLAGLGLNGCSDRTTPIESGKIDNIELRFVKRVARTVQSNAVDLEIYDSKGKLRAQFEIELEPYNSPPNHPGFIQYNDRKVMLRDGNFIENPLSTEYIPSEK